MAWYRFGGRSHLSQALHYPEGNFGWPVDFGHNVRFWTGIAFLCAIQPFLGPKSGFYHPAEGHKTALLPPFLPPKGPKISDFSNIFAPAFSDKVTATARPA